MLKQIHQRLEQHTPWTLTGDSDPQREASVMCLITDEPSPNVILTLRSGGLSSHAGEVAFPGGRRDAEDADLLATALRETEEEIGLSAASIQVIGSLSQVLSKHQLAVTPFVGLVRSDLKLRPNPEEIEAIFSAPLSFLAARENARLDRFKLEDGHTLYAPSWDYQGYEIWGLTAWVLAELLNVGLDAGIPTRPRPERTL